MYSPSLQCIPDQIADLLAGVRLRLRSVGSDERGFTPPELLVVCVIVGTLAAIAIPWLASQKPKALDARAEVLARTAQKAPETIATDSSGSYER